MSVCQGNAEIIRNLCAEYGIQASSIRGKGIDGDGHAWNQVQLDGIWYDDDFTLYQAFLAKNQLDKCKTFLMGTVNGVTLTDYNKYVAYNRVQTVGKNLPIADKKILLNYGRVQQQAQQQSVQPQEKEKTPEKSIKDEVGDELKPKTQEQQQNEQEAIKQWMHRIGTVAQEVDKTNAGVNGKQEVAQLIKDLDKKQIIEFKDVNFAYVPGEMVLKNFNLTVKPGEKIALVGATGSGKTTIVNLLMRFYDVTSGEIMIGGININDIEKHELRSLIAIVLQDTVLFKDTILNNIKYGRLNATKKEVVAASKLSNSNYFIDRLSNEYDTVLTESGSNLSGGQRQLLSIARAVLASPKILILDEATSSVDTRTEKNIQDGLVALMKNRTSLIIAHRLSTIRDADKIVVIDHGRIVEMGNHDELIKNEGVYYKLYQTQFAGNAI